MEQGFIFHTNHMAEKVKFEVKDGKTVIDNKEFIVDRVQPILLKEKRLGRTRFKPFYILKWDKIEPANIQVVDVDPNSEDYAQLVENAIPRVKSLEVVFPDSQEGDILPEMLRQTFDQRYLKHMKTYAGEGTGKGGKFNLKFQRWMIVPLALGISAVGMFVIQGGRFF